MATEFPVPDHSRVLKLASSAARADPQTLYDRLSTTHVHVSAEVDDPGIADALRVLVRNLRQLPIGLSASVFTRRSADRGQALLEELVRLCRGVDAMRPLQVGHQPRGSISVHLGTSPGRGTFLSAVPDGHGARLRSEGESFPTRLTPATGLGSVLTAALVSAEVLKVVAGLRSEWESSLSFDFCPVALTSEVGRYHNPNLTLDRVAMLGCGAIGTAIALILSLLGTTGAIAVVDPERFDHPNLITYSLGTQADAESETMKSALVANVLSHLDVTPLEADIQTYLERIDEGRYPMPRVILNGLDTVEARHDAARLHADLTIDGSTGGETGTTVGLRIAHHDGPCLRCFYPRAPATPTLAELTGLPPAMLRDGDAVLNEEHLAATDAAHRRVLNPLRGERICALARLLMQNGDPEGFRPSASFVAQVAASLVVGALIAEEQRVDRPDTNEIEFDALFGWSADAAQVRHATSTCVCQVDKELISQVRNRRGR